MQELRQGLHRRWARTEKPSGPGVARGLVLTLILGLYACAGDGASSGELDAGRAGSSTEATDEDAGKTHDAAAPEAENGASSASDCRLPHDAKEYDATYEIGTRLEAGAEAEFCVLYETGPKDVWMNSSDVVLSPGSHHGLLWQTDYTSVPDTDLDGDPVELGKVIDCEDGANGRFSVTRPLAGSQGRTNVTARGALPPDVAVKIPAHSYVVADLHMLNVQEQATDACMSVGVRGVDADQVEHEVGVLFLYDSFIAIPARQKADARMTCPITREISLKSAVSHMHKHGVGYEATWLDGDPFDPDTKTVQTLYETTNWDDPEDTVWSEPLQLNAGNWIDYACHYQNDTNQDVAQGLDTQDEMCMFIGLYWPYDAELSYCARSGQGDIDHNGSGGYQIGNGTLDGPGFIDCVLNADYDHGASEPCGRAECKNYPARVAWQSCFTRACSAIGRYTRAYLECLGDADDGCKEQCAGQSGATRILDCFADRCSAETQALNTTACE